MEGFTVEKERRENTRFMVEGNEVAVLGPLKEGLGVVIELSLSGFSFKCEEEEDVLKNNVDNLTRWIRDPQRFKPSCHMPDLHLTDAEAHAIAVYLEGLQ